MSKEDKELGYVLGTESDGTDSFDTITALVAADHAHEIKLRTMTWQKTACLLAGEQVCLAIMAQSWSLSGVSLSVLGWVPGIITMVLCGLLFWVTSITMHKYIMKHPHIMDISASMGIAILLFLIFAGIEKAPFYGNSGNYPTEGPVKTYAFPLPGTTWVACMNAVMNITFIWVPQILFPTFISEMERPQDFPKALAVLAVISAILFIVPSTIGFHFLGQYSTAPAFGSLGIVSDKKASFGFVIVPTLIIGAIYANVTGKFLYTRILGKSRHSHSHTVIGWGVWGIIMVVIWILGFVFAEIIPSMGDFLSLLSAAFDSFFGFIYFALAYWQLNRGALFRGLGRTAMTVLNVFILIVGLFLLGPGMYAAVEAIIADYAGDVTPAFTCANMAI
ncbi:Amino acid transporter, putative [Penicillium digitatum PHI26]|uniref:Amino acid transporter, putative n=3 Tax=Penicillium digitatum TaxID=36651 RepID=K9G6J4_PEND2|nr:Amino acid transporter, putative [Penicillium digitatum Pd1]EKV09141.1 Amino acid transporter, putative [Penicillium digitatum Pd1]EKV10408.1 Amino acid transporter, putative [Penicillium digitatum PHI26]